MTKVNSTRLLYIYNKMRILTLSCALLPCLSPSVHFGLVTINSNRLLHKINNENNNKCTILKINFTESITHEDYIAWAINSVYLSQCSHGLTRNYMHASHHSKHLHKQTLTIEWTIAKISNCKYQHNFYIDIQTKRIKNRKNTQKANDSRLSG